MNNQVEFSVVIPTYNEESKKNEMEEHLSSIKEYFNKINRSYEVLIVLDGPTDNTPQIIKEIIKDWNNFRVINRKENKGKGYSVREGLLSAAGRVRLFTDMDGATPINMLDRFLPEFEKKDVDVVIGSRDMKESKIKQHQPKWKEWAGDFGNILIQMGTGLYGMKDTQCGFKAFRDTVVKDVIPRTTVNRWGLDFEILMIANKLGYNIVEVPVEWIDKGDSAVGLGGYLSTFKDLFYVRWNLIKGVYKLDRKVGEIKKNI